MRNSLGVGKDYKIFDAIRMYLGYK